MADLPVAVITGAAGELGAAMAGRFHDLGYRLALFERDNETAEAAAAPYGDAAIGIAANQADCGAVDAAMERVASEMGRIDVVVANAGYAKFGPVLEMDARTWDRHVDVNLNGTFYVCQRAARVMAERRTGGSIVVVSSSLALAHADETSAYCTTKSALLPLVRSMAAELGIYRIRVNAVMPGVVETAMTQWMLDEPGVRDDLLQYTPIGRLGRPADIADAVEFLCSDKATFITGASLSVDGGQAIYGQPRWRRQDRTVPFEPRNVAALGQSKNK